MRRSIAKLKGLAFILWHTKHMFMHILLGLMWAWILRELWGELNVRWIMTAVVGSMLPDADHLLYFFTYGKRDSYTKIVLANVRDKHWRILFTFLEKGHKYNTNLSYHNVYSIVLLTGITALSFVFDWKVGVLLAGSMISHYLFDIAEDLVVLGKINSNWLRFGRSGIRKTASGILRR